MRESFIVFGKLKFSKPRCYIRLDFVEYIANYLTKTANVYSFVVNLIEMVVQNDVGGRPFVWFIDSNEI